MCRAGRVFAVEMALYTVAETVSGFWGGFMFDGLRLSTQGSSGVMAVVATAVTVRGRVRGPGSDSDSEHFQASPGLENGQVLRSQCVG